MTSTQGVGGGGLDPGKPGSPDLPEYRTTSWYCENRDCSEWLIAKDVFEGMEGVICGGCGQPVVFDESKTPKGERVTVRDSRPA
jgi:hypothetical protein